MPVITFTDALDVLSSREAMRQLAESRAATDAGDVLDADERRVVTVTAVEHRGDVYRSR